MKQETLEEAAEKYKYNPKGNFCFIEGAKWQQEKHKELFNQKTLENVAKELFLNGYECGVEYQERSYSEEEVIQLVSDWTDYRMSEDTKSKVTFKKYLEQFKKK